MTTKKRVEEKPVDLKAIGLELVETKAKSKPKAKKEIERRLNLNPSRR